MTNEQLLEIGYLKQACVEAALQVERSTVALHAADYKLQEYLYSMSRAQAKEPKPEPEQCICAAILMPDGEIIRGHRHDACYTVIRKRQPTVDSELIAKAKQGFVTSRNRFVDRKAAIEIQRAAGKKSASTGADLTGEDLFSEDLYLANCERLT